MGRRVNEVRPLVDLNVERLLDLVQAVISVVVAKNIVVQHLLQQTVVHLIVPLASWRINQTLILIALDNFMLIGEQRKFQGVLQLVKHVFLMIVRHNTRNYVSARLMFLAVSIDRTVSIEFDSLVLVD